MKLVFLLLLAVSAAAQSAVPSYAPQELADYLKKLQSAEDGCQHGSKDCESFLRDESVTKELQLPLGVQGCSNIAAKTVRLDGVHEAGFVRLQCGWDLNLVFSEKVGDRWRFLQTITIPNKYWEATVNVAPVTGDESQQVLIHKAQYDSGTGIGQQNFVVYKLQDGKLRPVLDAVESAHITRPWTDYEVSQESVFVYAPPSPSGNAGTDSPPIFKETQTLEFSGTKVELKREHTWSQEQRTFQSSQWYSARKLLRGKASRIKK